MPSTLVHGLKPHPGRQEILQNEGRSKVNLEERNQLGKMRACLGGKLILN
jgi:hypothetical protein